MRVDGGGGDRQETFYGTSGDEKARLSTGRRCKKSTAKRTHVPVFCLDESRRRVRMEKVSKMMSSPYLFSYVFLAFRVLERSG